MAREILGEYGPDRKVDGNRATCGGVETAKPLKYDPPKGPTEQMRQKPGLGGTTMPCGTQGKH